MKKLMVALCAACAALGAMADYTPIWRGLPKGYTQVEYVEANGTQYVDLGINAQSGLSLEADMLWVALPSDGGYCSAKSAAGQRIMLLWYDSNGWMFGYDNYFSTKVKASANTLYHVESALRDGSQTATITDGDGNVVLDWANDPAATGELDLGITLYLFANHNGTGVSGQTKSRCYALKIWRDNANGGRDLVGDFVPCKDDAGNTGLFNLVQNRFRAASKALTCGAVVYKPVDPSPYEGANVYVGCEPEGEWAVDENWSEGHVPTEGEDVVIADRTVSAAGPLAVKSLTIKEGGILKIQAEPAKTPTNLPSVFTDATVVTVTGELKVEDGGTLRPVCEVLTGAPVVFKVAAFTLEEGGFVDGNAAGWGWKELAEAPEGYTGKQKTVYTYAPGYPTGYSEHASHGAKGSKAAYGFKYAPFLPGSPGTANYDAVSRPGGGAVVIHSAGTVTLLGRVSCVSRDANYAGGSGGGIWIAGSDFRVASCARLVADGGAGGTGYGASYGGTGGRISLAAGLMDDDIAALANGETPEDLTYVDALDFIDASVLGGHGRHCTGGGFFTYNAPGTKTFVTRGEGTFVTAIPAPVHPAPVYPDPAGDGQARTFVGEDGGDWDDAANWSPSGVPGNADPVTIDGKWVCASSIVHAASLTVNAGATLTVGGRLQDITAQKPFADSTGFGLKIAGDLTVAGDLSVGGADSPVPVLISVGGVSVEDGGRLAVYAANASALDFATLYSEATTFAVIGAMTVKAGATVYPDADIRTGAPVKFKVGGVFTLEQGGTINADCRGYGFAPIRGDWQIFYYEGGNSIYSTTHGTFGPGSGDGYNRGGAYGAFWNNSYSYGQAAAPYLPGSPSGYYSNTSAKFVRGGGAVWVDALQVSLNGTITANGGCNGVFGQSSGGGVWICGKVMATSVGAVITADGGIGGICNYDSIASGGRVALGVALTDEEADALAAGTTPETVTVDSGIAGFTATALGGTKSSGATKADPGTIRTATGSFLPDTSVTVAGDPEAAVSPAFVYGARVAVEGSVFTLPAIGYGDDPDDPTARYSYAGWRLEDEEGQIVDSGKGAVSFTVPHGNSTLYVIWENRESSHAVTIADGTLGSVSVGGVAHTESFSFFTGSEVTLTARPADGAEFLYWVGEVPAGCELDTSLTFDPAIGRAVMPVFRPAAAATARAWTGAAGNGLWLDAANWSPEGIPGFDDDVAIGDGLVVVTNFVRVKNLALSGTARLFAGANIALGSTAAVTGKAHTPYVDRRIGEVAILVGTLALADSAGLVLGGQDEDYPSLKPRFEAESVMLSGDSVLAVTAGEISETDTFETGCGTVTVSETFELSGTAQFVPVSDEYTGGSLVVRTGKFLLGEEAKVNALGRGFDYRRYKSPQIIAPGQGGSYTIGAGYGGTGSGANATSGRTYGFANAPIHPGSCNGCYADSASNVYPGGGLIRIHARSAVLNGTLDAKPTQVKGYGGPSGGGIWVTTSGKMEIGATFAAIASGGLTSDNYSSFGGGGRIALGEWLTDAEVAQLAKDGELPIRGVKQKPIPVLTEAEFEALHPGADIDVTVTVSRGTAKPGTFVFLDGKTKGFMLLVK